MAAGREQILQGGEQNSKKKCIFWRAARSPNGLRAFSGRVKKP